MNNYCITKIGAPINAYDSEIETIHFGGCAPQKINDNNRWIISDWIQRR